MALGNMCAAGFALASALAITGCATPGAPIAPPRASDYAIGWVPIPENADFGTYNPAGIFTLKIGAFNPRSPVRNITVSSAGSRAAAHPQPTFATSPSRWDIDANSLCTGSAKQKVRVDVVIDSTKGVNFQTIGAGATQQSPISAVDAASAAAFSHATLPVEGPRNVWTSSFWVLCEATTGARVSKFNIAIVVREASGASRYTLPLVIDPPIRNRGRS